MPRYFCDYCQTYLTHDSAPGRKQHNRGWKHKENVKLYYDQYVAAFQAQKQEQQQQQQQLLGACVPACLPACLPACWECGVEGGCFGFVAGWSALGDARWSRAGAGA
jgi:hypothetical protein